MASPGAVQRLDRSLGAAVEEAVRRRHRRRRSWCALSRAPGVLGGEPEFALLRGDEPGQLRDVLAEAAERVDVRLLLWAGASLPILRPSGWDAIATLRALRKGTRVRAVLDATDRLVGACHEKIVVVDDREAFVGGIDPTSMAGRPL